VRVVTNGLSVSRPRTVSSSAASPSVRGRATVTTWGAPSSMAARAARWATSWWAARPGSVWSPVARAGSTTSSRVAAEVPATRDGRVGGVPSTVAGGTSSSATSRAARASMPAGSSRVVTCQRAPTGGSRVSARMRDPWWTWARSSSLRSRAVSSVASMSWAGAPSSSRSAGSRSSTSPARTVAEVVTGSASSGAVEVEDDDEVDGVEAGVDGSAGAGGAAPAARRWATSGVTDNVRGIEGWPVATSVRVAMPSSTASGRGAAGAARRSVASVPDRISARSATDAGSSSSSLSGPRRR
jgi:hypothetical protein